MDRLAASFRDPSGFLFKRNDQIFRQVNLCYKDDYDFLMSCGLYNQLIQNQCLIPHRESDDPPNLPAIAYKVIQPEKVDFISYPYEWAFSQLKDAALQTLRIQNIALRAGMILKDASAYNIQFQHDSPILIDTLSFTKYREGQPWVAYRQFCQHFVAPLALMSLTDIRLNKLLQIYIDGIPLDLASKLLPSSSRLKGGILTHIHLHAAAQKRYTEPTEALSKRTARVSKEAMIGLTDSLANTVKKLTWKASGSDWAEYYRSTNYSPEAFKLKKQIVHDLIHELAPKSIWDLGANTGEFSRLGQDIEGCQIISTDIDAGAVELNYRECKKSQIKNILPLVIDLTNPSPAIGWSNNERQSYFQRAPADLLLALALIHHLAISNNVPLQDIAQTFASLGNNLIIEFVPKEDSQVKKLLTSRDDIFYDYSNEGFLQAFTQYFTLQKQIPIPETCRTIYWFSKN